MSEPTTLPEALRHLGQLRQVNERLRAERDEARRRLAEIHTVSAVPERLEFPQ